VTLKLLMAVHNCVCVNFILQLTLFSYFAADFDQM